MKHGSRVFPRSKDSCQVLVPHHNIFVGQKSRYLNSCQKVTLTSLPLSPGHPSIHQSSRKCRSFYSTHPIIRSRSARVAAAPADCNISKSRFEWKTTCHPCTALVMLVLMSVNESITSIPSRVGLPWSSNRRGQCLRRSRVSIIPQQKIPTNQQHHFS